MKLLLTIFFTTTAIFFVACEKEQEKPDDLRQPSMSKTAPGSDTTGTGTNSAGGTDDKSR
jgi:hypothetical protein